MRDSALSSKRFLKRPLISGPSDSVDQLYRVVQSDFEV